MIFGLFKKKDPVCGMKQEKGRGFVDDKTGHWFCSQSCKEKYVKSMANAEKSMHKGGCCH